MMRQAVFLFVSLALAGRVSGQAVVQCANWAGQFDEMNRVCCADQPGGECATGESNQRALTRRQTDTHTHGARAHTVLSVVVLCCLLLCVAYVRGCGRRLPARLQRAVRVDLCYLLG